MTAPRLLDRQPPPGYHREWQERLRQLPSEVRPNAQGCLVFRLHHEWMALPARVIREVLNLASVHHLPLRSDEILRGVVNVRGELQLCVSLHQILQLTPEATAPRTLSRRVYPRLVVLERDAQCFAFAAEEVYGVVAVVRESLEKPPVTVDRALYSFTLGIFHLRDQRVGLLDEDLLFHRLAKIFT